MDLRKLHLFVGLAGVLMYASVLLYFLAHLVERNGRAVQEVHPASV
jgi:hypothetical protein